MDVYPLEPINLSQAKELQFRLVDLMQKHFNGEELLEAGDYGLVPELGQPRFTKKVERVLADFFGGETAMLVRGAGTGAIRLFFIANLNPEAKILVHKAPVYPTTKVTVDSMGFNIVKIDFNKINEIDLPDRDFSAILVQHTRQKIDDKYNLDEVLGVLKKNYPRTAIISDDNYAVMKVNKIGVQMGADVSAFSLFKLLGPPGVGCIVGKADYIEKMRELNYSGGSQIQGPEAFEALKSLVYAPVSLAIQAEVTEEVNKRLNDGEVTEVENSFIANAQSRVILVRFKEKIAKDFLQNVTKFGGVSRPVGAESRYEVGAMFYRISGTFRKENPDLENYMIRINPMRAGADSIIKVIKKTLKYIK
ncbi:MAG: aminotransferase class V-fold PLP-dependent enzyme [Halanaerobiales bacterium]